MGPVLPLRFICSLECSCIRMKYYGFSLLYLTTFEYPLQGVPHRMAFVIFFLIQIILLCCYI